VKRLLIPLLLRIFIISRLCSTGLQGADGSGDIMQGENMEAFQEFVLTHTDGQGVHFVMADGVGFVLISVYRVVAVWFALTTGFPRSIEY